MSGLFPQSTNSLSKQTCLFRNPLWKTLLVAYPKLMSPFSLIIKRTLILLARPPPYTHTPSLPWHRGGWGPFGLVSRKADVGWDSGNTVLLVLSVTPSPSFFREGRGWDVWKPRPRNHRFGLRDRKEGANLRHWWILRQSGHWCTPRGSLRLHCFW